MFLEYDAMQQHTLDDTDFPTPKKNCQKYFIMLDFSLRSMEIPKFVGIKSERPEIIKRRGVSDNFKDWVQTLTEKQISKPGNNPLSFLRRFTQK